MDMMEVAIVTPIEITKLIFTGAFVVGFWTLVFSMAYYGVKEIFTTKEPENY